MDMHTYSLWRVGSAAMLVDERTPAEQRQDVFESVLYAQLQAEQYCARLQVYPDWSRHYLNALTSRGWALMSRKGKAFDLGIDADHMPLHWLAGYLSEQCPEAAQALQAAVIQLQRQGVAASDGDGGRYAAYELAVVRPDHEMWSCGLGVLDRRPEVASSPAGAPPSSDYLSAWRGVLDEDDYAQMRDAIHKRLVAHEGWQGLIEHLGALPKGEGNGQS